MNVHRRQVELLEKNKPRQERAKRTYEGILEAAAQLLLEVGVERISTNLIAERAGVTVPALYRYFPNKYAVLNALGAKLMDRQNEVVQDWFDGNLADGRPESLLAEIYPLLKATYDVTRDQAGGLEIIQSLRAVAPLQDLRLTSHRLIAEQFADILAGLLPQIDVQALYLQARLSIDMGYGMVEMALEDHSLPAEEVLQQGAIMIQRYWQHALDELGA
jgi:AcrR family transcriptional regulator